MNACKRFGLRTPFASLLAALAATACTVPADDAGSANSRVDNVVVVGTSVTSALYTTGELGLTTVPKAGADEVVLAKDLKVALRITSPIELDVATDGTDCTEPEQGKKSISVGVIIDDSGSMSSNDPTDLRKAATVSFLKTLGTDDKVLLTDYGHTFDDKLRDLLCVSAAKRANGSFEDEEKCNSVKPTFTADKAALVRATEEINSSGGTPLYESCVEMVPMVDTVKEGRRGILLLSDGIPDSEDKRDACHNAAKAAKIPVFTVGLGPAAEGDVSADPAAVKVLRELATDTGGSYASANDAGQLDSLFRNMGTALARGSCRTRARVPRASEIKPGDHVRGEVTIGTNGAKAAFDFVAPALPPVR